MTLEQIATAFKVVTELIGVVIWPIIVLIILKRFDKPLAEFLFNLSEFSLKAPGMDLTAKRRQAEAAAALGAAVATRAAQENQPERVFQDARSAAGTLADTITPRILRRVGDATVLWVDDRPENNRFERQALEALGLQFVLSTSTEDALEKVRHRTFDVIISDMGRPPDFRAGYTLLDALRAQATNTPFIIYAGSRAPEHVGESRKRGALGCTNQPEELIRLVLAALQG